MIIGLILGLILGIFPTLYLARPDFAKKINSGISHLIDAATKQQPHPHAKVAKPIPRPTTSKTTVRTPVKPTAKNDFDGFN
jgi:hypothetical protein